MRPNTRTMPMETLASLSLEVMDIAVIAKHARERDVKLIV